ncbi:hypothetical protein SDC9_72283 [bioreactor metagenome]|uniref:Uncharacterized protein n=1 Tax=bioreactor metagenome TaxID=1076179 RepID=A0A644YH26_9ZZZZ
MKFAEQAAEEDVKMFSVLAEEEDVTMFSVLAEEGTIAANMIIGCGTILKLPQLFQDSIIMSSLSAHFLHKNNYLIFNENFISLILMHKSII